MIAISGAAGANQAQVSSNSQVCLAPGRAHGICTHHRPVLGTFHPRGRGLQIRLGGAHVQGAPPSRPILAVVAGAAAPAPRAAARLRRLAPHRKHQHLARWSPDSLRARSPSRSTRPRPPCSGPPAPQRIPWICATPSLLLRLEPSISPKRKQDTVLRPNLKSADPQQRHKSPIEAVEGC